MVRRGKDSKPEVEEHPGGRHITVTAQQSRYALDAVDAPASKEILVKDLSISVANRELLSRTTLHLVESRHYVLVGRNGTGKSTLLKTISDGLIPGIPWSTRILLLGQTQDGGLEAGIPNSNETVLQHVLRSDRCRERLTHEFEILTSALDEAKDALAPLRAHRELQHERLALKLQEAHRIAERRSGARGKSARKELVKLEERFAESQARLEEPEADVDPMRLSAETKDAADMLKDVQASLELMDSPGAETRVRKVLLGLGFKEERINGLFAQLSGGWRTRCELACALTQYADVLLLDEPTNFLDLPSIIWLQDYINGLRDTTILITTHDRDFGDAVADEIILLRDQVLETFRGNFSLWERERWKKIRHLTKMKDAKDKQKKHIEKSIVNNMKAARDKGDDKKLKQAASRQKKLDERWGVEVGVKGGRFKLNRDLGGYHATGRAEIEIPDFEPLVKLAFPQQPPGLRFPGALVSLEKVSFAYRKTLVLKDVSLTIHPGSRIGLVGLNGAGKTTLVSLIMGAGHEEGSAPTSGIVTRHARATFGWFTQLSVEGLNAIASSHPKLTALQHILDVSSDMEEKTVRQILGSLGLHGNTVSDVPIGLLSGGQKVRIALAKLLWPPPQLLVLDEVTTHLDADTILSLVLALREYKGALLVVTHDRFFMRTVVEGASPYKLVPGVRDELQEGESEENEEDKVPGFVYRLNKGQLKKLDGGVEQYAEISARAAAKLGRGGDGG